MKKISTCIIMLIGSVAMTAQDNKPIAGNFGIGYGVSFLPTDQHINFTYFATDRIEVGGAIGLGYSHSRTSTYDSTTVIATNLTVLPAGEEKRTVTTSTSFMITPLVKYHFKTNNNLDIYAGGNLPIGISAGPKTVVSDIITANNYNSTTSETTKPPVTASVGLSVILGCQYFFYQHLAIGAEANVGFTSSIDKGNKVVTDAESNSGSNNPASGSSFPNEVTTTRVNMVNTTLGMLHRFALNLTWYFGTKKS